VRGERDRATARDTPRTVRDADELRERARAREDALEREHDEAELGALKGLEEVAPEELAPGGPGEALVGNGLVGELVEEAR